jgi:hypothetical protein
MRLAVSLVGIATALAGVAISSEARAWGKFGHLTICDLAYRNLTPVSRDVVRQLLRGGITVPGRGEMPARHYTSFNVGCLEEDEIPRRNPNDHFINLSRQTAAITSDECPAAAARGECILVGIRRDLEILKDTSRSRPDRVIALMALGHWVGDIHQPLHVSFADDRGGNGIDARVSGGCGKSGYRATNLHAVWDNCILEAGLFERVRKRADFKKTWGKRTITYRAVDTLLANTSITKERQLAEGEPWQWAAESFSIALDPEVHYCVRVGDSCNYSETATVLKRNDPKRMEQLDQAYLASFDRLAEERVARAGFRLAHLLNQALDPGYQGPIRNSTQPE